MEASRILLYIIFLYLYQKRIISLNNNNIFKQKIYIIGIQISLVRFPKDSSSCCEWFIVTAGFDGFREVKYLLTS